MNRLHQISKKKRIHFHREHDSLPSQVFWVSFLLLLIIDCIENTSVIYMDAMWVKGMYLFRNVLYLALLAKAAFLSTYRKEELIGVGICYVISFFSLLGSGDFGLFKFFIVAIAAKDESPRKIVIAFFKIKAIAIALTLALWKIGILPALYYQDDSVGYYNTYGFCHRNVLGANVAVLCLAWFYLRYRKLKIQDVLAWAGIALITYKLALSRTSLIIIVLIIAGVFLFQKYEECLMRIPNMKKMILWGFIGILFVCIVCTLFYSQDSSFWDIVDKIFTKRIRFANYCFKEYGLSLFGQKIPFVSSIEAQNTEVNKLILDNAYMRVLLYYGILPGALFLAIYYKALKFSFRKRDCALLTSLIVFAVYGLSERYMLDVFYQFPLLIAYGKYFFRKNSYGEDELKKPLEYANDVLWFIKKRRKSR